MVSIQDLRLTVADTMGKWRELQRVCDEIADTERLVNERVPGGARPRGNPRFLDDLRNTAEAGLTTVGLYEQLLSELPADKAASIHLRVHAAHIAKHQNHAATMLGIAIDWLDILNTMLRDAPQAAPQARRAREMG